MSEVSLLYVTTSSELEAQQIAEPLVQAHLVACANIIPGMKSVYRWNSEIQKDDEVVLILKTRTELVNRVTREVERLHSYDCPCVIALPVGGGNAGFLDWIVQETEGA